LTGAGVVSMVITELGVFAVGPQGNQMGFTLTELAPGVTLQEVREKTEAEFAVAPGVG